MTSQQLDAKISAYLADGPAEFPSEWREAIAAAAEQTAQPPTDWRAIFDRRWPRLAIIVLVIGLLAALATPLVGRPQVETRPQPQPTTEPLSCHSSQRSCRGRRTPCANPTRCRCAQSHPAAPMSLMPCGSLPSRETARSTPGSTRWTTGFQGATRALISSISSSSRRSTPFASIRTSFACSTHRPSCWRGHPDPEVEWISYGIVVDRDGDGSPDGQVGLDNIPGGFFRAWYTEPFTGDTKSYLGSNGTADGAYGESEMPMADGGTRPGRGYLWIARAWPDRSTTGTATSSLGRADPRRPARLGRLRPGRGLACLPEKR